jgi:hypothetical protein
MKLSLVGFTKLTEYMCQIFVFVGTHDMIKQTRLYLAAMV